jgi:DNA-binding transcriptional LysR family regulator
MTLRQLSYWLAVVEEGSFTRAARRMHVSQPSLSQQIRALEAEIGGDLLERLPRSVRLTSAGKAMLPHVKSAVQSIERASNAARMAFQLEAGELEICTVRSIAAGLLPGLVHSWHQRHPGTVVRLHEFSHRRLAEEAVISGTGDLGIGPPPIDWGGSMCSLGWEEFVIVLPSDDPLASSESVALEALADRDWVMFDDSHGLNEVLAAACHAANFTPTPAVETSQVETAARLAAAGIGPTLVPGNTVPEGLDAAILRVSPPLGRELTAYTRGDWRAVDLAFVEIIQSADWQRAPSTAVLIA